MLRALFLALVFALHPVCVSGAARSVRHRQPEVTLVAVGDVLFARGVKKQIERHGDDWLFGPTQKLTRSADIALCNLECSLSNRGVPQHRRFQFRADAKCAGSLQRAGFDIISLANNHTMDYGREAMLDTADSVKKAGMLPVGAGKDRNEAQKLHIMKKNDLRIGFLAFTDIWNGGIVRMGDRPTVAGVDIDQIAAQIRSAKKQCDCLVVSFHWGIEYAKRPSERQKTLAHLSVDSGADVVLGHHPHVLQPTEIYRGKPIIYSMGAYVWDGKLFGASKSAIYYIELAKSSAKLKRVMPVKISSCRPIPSW